MTSKCSRRAFVGSTLVSGAATIVPRHVLGGAGHVAPSEKVNVAHIGMGTQSFRELGGLLEEPRVQIVAICDPNTNSNDYVEWGKGEILRRIRNFMDAPNWREGETGCPGGREVGRLVVDTFYKNRRGASGASGCRTYADFREMLAAEDNVDAVKILTPDHSHATLAIAAMKTGKNVVMHKPIANRLQEGRLVLDAVKQTGAGTHLLAYGSGAGNAKIAKHVRSGAIGQLREIHNWTNRPVWPQYTEIPVEQPPVPKGFDWDLWLGPEQYRAYHPHYTHTVYRGWYDFGGGSMADMGIYSLWPVFTELELPSAKSAHAWGTHTCQIVDNVSRPVRNDFAYPTGCTIRFEFPDVDGRRQPDLFWYDGGMKPRLPEWLEAINLSLPKEGILFLGDEGAIMAEFTGKNPRIWTPRGQEPLQLDQAGASDEPPWLVAMRGEESPGSFLLAGAITDTVNLGTIALRAGEKVHFDADKVEITSPAGAGRYLRREYRDGWEL